MKTKATKTPAQPEGPQFRVVKMPKATRLALKDARTINNETTIANCVATQLPSLVNALKNLGFSTLTEPSHNFRLPFAEATLADLKTAGEEVGVPASHLLLLCLATLTSRPTKTRKARSTKKGAK